MVYDVCIVKTGTAIDGWPASTETLQITKTLPAKSPNSTVCALMST